MVSSAVGEAIAGVGAGAAATLLLHPLDVVRVRLQIQTGTTPTTGRFNRPYYRGTWHAFTTIYGSEGWRALYQGMLPNLVGATLSWGMYFFWYDILKRARQRHKREALASMDYSVAAALAGAMTSVVTNPIWLVKTRMAMQLRGHPDAYRGLVDGLARVYREEGVRGLYKGLAPSLFGTLHGSVQFAAYEYLKKLNASSDKPTVVQTLLASSSSKVVATAATYPFQVLRSRLQDQRGRVQDPSQGYTGVMDAAIKTARNEGVRGFYRGIVPSVLRVLPATCVTFVVYEQLASLFRQERR